MRTLTEECEDAFRREYGQSLSPRSGKVGMRGGLRGREPRADHAGGSARRATPMP
jgi:hypothetical protein